MDTSSEATPKKVLIASSHTLFGKGLQNLLEKRWGERIYVVGLVATTEEATAALQSLTPDMVIIDYDDESINLEEFLKIFVAVKEDVRVVALSLAEEPEGGKAVVYDRHTMMAARIEEWMELDFPADTPSKSQTETNEE